MSLDSRLRQQFQYSGSLAPTEVSSHVLPEIIERADRIQRRRRWTRIAAVPLAVAAAVLVALAIGASQAHFETNEHEPVVNSPSPTPSETELSQTFRSSVNKYSIAHPAGWTVKLARQPGQEDVLRAPDGSGWRISSEQIPQGMTDDQWLRAYARPGNGLSTNTEVCFPSLSDYGHVDIGGHQGLVRGGINPCNQTQAVVIVGNRAYEFTATPSLRGWTDQVYNRDTFNQILATVNFLGAK